MTKRSMAREGEIGLTTEPTRASTQSPTASTAITAAAQASGPRERYPAPATASMARITNVSGAPMLITAAIAPAATAATTINQRLRDGRESAARDKERSLSSGGRPAGRCPVDG